MFKTTVCLLLLTTAGFSMDMPGGGDDKNPPPNKFEGRSAPSTPVKVSTSLDTSQQQDLFATPNDQTIQPAIPGAPSRSRVRNARLADGGNGIDRLVGSVTSSPIFKKRKVAEDITVVDSKGGVVFSTAKKKGECVSPVSVTDHTRLETSAYTPAVHPSMVQFTENKNIQSRTWFDPVLEDLNNLYLPEEEESVISVGGLAADVQDMSIGSFVIHGAHLLGDSVDQDDSEGSFVIHGVHLLGDGVNDSVVTEAEGEEGYDDESVISAADEGNSFLGIDAQDLDDDAISVIADENSVNGDFSDVDANYIDGYFSGEE